MILVGQPNTRFQNLVSKYREKSTRSLSTIWEVLGVLFMIFIFLYSGSLSFLALFVCEKILYQFITGYFINRLFANFLRTLIQVICVILAVYYFGREIKSYFLLYGSFLTNLIWFVDHPRFVNMMSIFVFLGFIVCVVFLPYSGKIKINNNNNRNNKKKTKNNEEEIEGEDLSSEEEEEDEEGSSSSSSEEEEEEEEETNILTLESIQEKIEILKIDLTVISPDSEGGIEGWVDHINQFSSTTEEIKKELSQKLDFLEDNKELQKLEQYFLVLSKHRNGITKGISNYQMYLKSITNYSKECLSQCSLLNRAFMRYKELLAQTKQEGKDLKRMKFHLELNEEYLTEQEEQRIQKKIQQRRKAYQEHKRELERLQKFICQPYPKFVPSNNSSNNNNKRNINSRKVKCKNTFNTMKTHLINGIRETKQKYMELLNELNVQHSTRRRRSLIDVFVNLNLFLFHRTLKDYTNLTLLYLNNENRIYKGTLSIFNEESQEMKEKPVVIKCLPYTPKTERVVQNEVLNLLDLMNHPAVISINCVFQFKDTYTKREYLALEMDYMDYDLLHWMKKIPFQPNESIKDILRLPNKRSMVEIKSIFRQIMTAVSYIHMKGIIHADFKHQNILVLDRPPAPKVKIIDFGVSKNSNSSFFTTLGMEQRHTFRYKPPEGKVTKAYDIYSLGRMLFESICPPNLVDSIVVTEEKLIFPQHKDIPSNGMDLVQRMMDTCPFKRISANEVLQHQFFGYDEIEKLKREVMDPQTKIGLVLSHLREVSENALLIRPSPKALTVGREDNDLVEKVLDLMGSCRTIADIVAPWDVTMSNKFEVETGIDQGGVTSELYVLFHERITKYLESSNEEVGLFLPTDDSVELKIFYNFGRYMLRMLLLPDVTINIRFAKFLYNFILNKEPKSLPQMMENCEDFDGVYTVNIKKLVLESNEEDLTGFTFRTENGKEESLTNSNTLEFMWYKLKDKMYGENKVRFGNLEVIRKGFYEFLEENTIKVLGSLNCEEFEKILCGERKRLTYLRVMRQIKFDVRIWNGSDVLKLSKSWMERYLREGCRDLRKFIYYCTSLTNLPAHEDLSKKIKMMPHDVRFYAHTCDRSLDVKITCENYEQLKTELDSILQNLELAGLYEDFS